MSMMYWVWDSCRVLVALSLSTLTPRRNDVFPRSLSLNLFLSSSFTQVICEGSLEAMVMSSTNTGMMTLRMMTLRLYFL